MKLNPTAAILFLILLSCETSKNEDKEALVKLSDEETIERVKSGSLDYSYAKFMSQDGSELTDEERNLLNQGQLAKDFYVNKHNTIKEVRLRPITVKDKLVEVQRRDLASDAVGKLALVEIDCDKLDSIYSKVYKTDQEVRTGGSGEMTVVDNRNQQIVVSAIKECGWTEKHLETIWIVFQHSPPGIMTYYYPTLKSYSEQGLLDKSKIALMEDRMLMRHGYKQIYGSQISSGHLYDLEKPDSVNIRRAKMGLQPIEEYLTHWNLNFEEEVTRMNAK